MDLRHLTHFSAVLEQGSLSRAAQSLGISHQALSKSVACLERTLQVKLLERTSRGMTPTLFGEALAKHAGVIISETRNARLELDALRGGHLGSVTIGSGLSAAALEVPEAISALLRRKPGVSVRVQTGTFEELVQQLLSGSIDLFVGTAPDTEADALVMKHHLYNEEDRIVARAGHPLVGRKDIGFSDLAQYEWICSAGSERFHKDFLNLFYEAGSAPPPISVASDSIEVTRALVARSDRLVLLPYSTIDLFERNSMLSVIEFEPGNWSRAVSICTRRRGSFPPIVRLFIEELRNAAQALAQRHQSRAAA